MSEAKTECNVTLPPLHALQSFQSRRIARSQIKNAAYNPRKISITARVKLEGLLEEFGLVESLVWNERTGNLVGGNTRLNILDALSEAPEYSLDVAVVDLDEVKEKSLNIALNARGAQGEYDPEKLDALLNELEGQVEIDLADLIADNERQLKKLRETGAPSATEAKFNYQQQFGIIITCADEAEQKKFFEALTELGYTCKVVVT